MTRTFVMAAAASAVAIGCAAPLYAQGSSVYTHSSCIVGRGGAGVADPCEDASAVFYNPAALSMQPSMLGVGVTGIRTGGSFTYNGTGEVIDRPAETAPVPFGFASVRLSDRLAAGIGVWAPYGLGVEWPIEFEGRFVGYDNQLQGLYIQPTLAYSLAPWISVGAGLDIVRGLIEINQRVDLATTPLPTIPGATFGNLGIPLGTDFADARLEATGTAVTFHVGLMAELSEQLSFGFRYLHFADIEFNDGTAEFSQVPTNITLPAGNPINPATAVPLDAVLAAQFQGGSLVNQSVNTRLELPNQAVVGFRYRPVPRVSILADYQFIGWKSFSEAPLDFENATDQTLVLDYQNTDTYRVGADLGLTDALTLRGGFVYNTAAERAASVSPLLPEAERNYYTAGLGWRVTDRLGVDLGYQFIVQADRQGSVRGRTSRLQTAEQLNAGLYSIDAHVFGATLSYRFGGDRGAPQN